jgi:hypothetical protein
MYLSNCVRIIDTAGDESKSYWFARMLLSKQLLDTQAAESYFSTDMDLALFIENTRILREGIDELLDIYQRGLRGNPQLGDVLSSVAQTIEARIGAKRSPYFLEYFFLFLSHKSGSSNSPKTHLSELNHVSDNDDGLGNVQRNMLYQMIIITWMTRQHGNYISNNVEEFYGKL